MFRPSKVWRAACMRAPPRATRQELVITKRPSSHRTCSPPANSADHGDSRQQPKVPFPVPSGRIILASKVDTSLHTGQLLPRTSLLILFLLIPLPILSNSKQPSPTSSPTSPAQASCLDCRRQVRSPPLSAEQTRRNLGISVLRTHSSYSSISTL